MSTSKTTISTSCKSGAKLDVLFWVIVSKTHKQIFTFCLYHCSCRYGAAEPHTVSAFLGGKDSIDSYSISLWNGAVRYICSNLLLRFILGSAAQEAIKIISHQFVPFNNTFIYNAMSQTSATLRLWVRLLKLLTENMREKWHKDKQECNRSNCKTGHWDLIFTNMYMLTPRSASHREEAF